jgi:mycothiol system anti-sigma-R factor
LQGAMSDDDCSSRCREVLRRAYLFMDGEVLSYRERVEIESHLEECGPCYKRYGLEREVYYLVSRLRGCSPCPDELRSRIMSLLKEA